MDLLAMPIVLIEVRKKYSIEQEVALMKAVHLALQETFKLNNDINVRLLVHEPHRSSLPSTIVYPELYTLISIDCIVGRSLATKRTLYRSIVENLEKEGIPKDHVKILLRETSHENWGIRGGLAACDVELGYVVEI
jgi:phenylpyruvate tautomerase PptA (4-oxalocrotonate tautomerase family)